MDGFAVAKRIRDGIAAKKSQGRQWANNPPYGHRWTADGKLAPNAAEQRTIALVRRLRKEETSYRGIVAELRRRRRFNRAGNPFGLAAVQKMLAR